MKTKQWKKAAALMSAGAMTASVFAAPLAVKADDKVTISFHSHLIRVLVRQPRRW